MISLSIIKNLFDKISSNNNLYIYWGFVAFSFGIRSYLDGKKCLLDNRNNKFIDNEHEWNIIKAGVYKNILFNFTSSFIWPIDGIINFIPLIVYKLNMPSQLSYNPLSCNIEDRSAII